jgi:hypothetical protein
MAGRVIHPAYFPVPPCPSSSVCSASVCPRRQLDNADGSLYCPGNRKHLPRLTAHHLLNHLLVRPPPRLLILLVLITRVTGVVLIFVEIPLLMRICPTSEKFDTLVRRFNENWPRAGMYVGYTPPPFFGLPGVSQESGWTRDLRVGYPPCSSAVSFLGRRV